jgi:protein-L-isoaspartate(D-aspartate) O-methyltransferase
MVENSDFCAEKAALAESIARHARQAAPYLGTERIDPAVMAALMAVPREAFVPDDLIDRAYDNRPLPIGHGQTISQPFIVAAMTQLLGLEGTVSPHVLEIGTGCGYQAAVLAAYVGGTGGDVVSVEVIPELAEAARARLASLGLDNVAVHLGDGREGWPADAPYDGILVTAAPKDLPPALAEQLKPGARLVIPLGTRWTGQRLVVLEKQQDGSLAESCGLPVAFVPLVG